MPTPDNTTVRIEVTDGASIPDPKDKRVITAWSLSLFGAIFLLIFLCVRHPDPYWNILSLMVGYEDAASFSFWAFLNSGIVVTFKVTFYAICLAVPMGCLVGLGRLARNRFINLLASTYVEIIRGIPLLVQLFYLYYGLSALFNIQETLAAVLSLSFCYGAYMGEVFRAGISAIPKGQTEAARSLGFNRFDTMLYIVLPQALRTILPPVGNECIALLKDSSLISILAVADMFRVGREYASTTFNHFEAFTVVAVVYLIITLILSKCVSILESRLSYYDKR